MKKLREAGVENVSFRWVCCVCYIWLGGHLQPCGRGWVQLFREGLREPSCCLLRWVKVRVKHVIVEEGLWSFRNSFDGGRSL